MRLFYCVLLIFLSLFGMANDHNPILPQPQKVIYGKGQLSLAGIKIGFANKPSAEDRFAAKELSGILSKITATPVSVKETIVTGPSVIFERTGDKQYKALLRFVNVEYY